MQDLSTQIETLYRVIGQLRPQNEPANEPGAGRNAHSLELVAQPAPRQHERHRASVTSRGAQVRWIFKFYCLWFSLPLSVWFSSGWIGLFFYWRALSGTARLIDLAGRFRRRSPLRRAQLDRRQWAPIPPRGFTSSPFRLSPFQLRSLETIPFKPGSLQPIPLQSMQGGARCSAIELEAR